MKKVYFACNWGLSSRQMCESYIMQTPSCSGVWEDIQVTYDIQDADYLIIEDNCSIDEAKCFNNKTRIYFSREAMDTKSHLKYTDRHFVRSSYWDKSGYLYTKWIYANKSSGGINLNYDQLIQESPVSKTKLISTIQSGKTITQTHKDRVKFIETMANSFNLDVFGPIHCNNSTLLDNDKKNGLDDYKYCLAFDNQMNIDNFFGTQFTDSLLRWTVPFYGGGADLGKYFPEKSFIKINPSDLTEIDKIKQIIENECDYEERLGAITEARNLILNEYNIWPTIKKVIDTSEASLK